MHINENKMFVTIRLGYIKNFPIKIYEQFFRKITTIISNDLRINFDCNNIYLHDLLGHITLMS